MSALDGISEKQTYAVPVKFTVEFESEVLITATSTEDITSKTGRLYRKQFRRYGGQCTGAITKSDTKKLGGQIT